MSEEESGSGSEEGAGESPKKDSPSPRSTLLTAFGIAAAVAIVILGIGLVVDIVDDGGGVSGPTVPVDLSEWSIDGDLTVPVGAGLDVQNEGTLIHNLYVEDGPNTEDIEAGDSELLGLSDLDEGDHVIFCDIPGHRQNGMEAVLVVDANA